MKKGQAAFIYIGIICFLSYGIYSYVSTKNYNTEYFKNLKLELVGVVKEKEIITNDWGMLYIDVLNSSIESYDVRPTWKPYYCVIKYGRAEIIENFLSDCNVGDTILIDSEKGTASFKNKDKCKVHQLHVNDFLPLKFRVMNLHRL